MPVPSRIARADPARQGVRPGSHWGRRVYPYRTTPASRSRAISGARKPASARIASVCSPIAGGGPAGAPGVSARRTGHAEQPHRTEARMLDGGERAVDQCLGIDQHLGHRADARAGHVRLGELRFPLGGRPRREPLADRADQLRLVRVAPDHRPEARVVQPRLEAEGPAEARPELRELHVEIEVSLPRGIDPRHAVAEEVTDRLRRLHGLRPEGPARLHREHAVEERGLDPLAFAGLAPGDEGEEHAGDGEAPGVVVHEAPTHELRRRLVRGALLPGEAAVGLHDRVEPRPLGERADLPERGHRAVDEPRVLGAERRGVEPEAGRHARPEALHEEVGVPREPLHDGEAVRVLQINGEAPLAPVDAEEVAGQPRQRRGIAPERVALERLHLDDVGPVGREERRRDGPGDDRRAVDHAEALERTGHGAQARVARGTAARGSHCVGMEPP